LRASAVPVWAVLGSQVLVSVGMAVIGGLSILVLGAIVYGTPLPESPAQSLAAFALAVLSFAALGVLLGAVLPTTRAAQAVGLLLFFVMMFISGAGPPREVLSGPMQAISDFLPLTHVIILLQEPWLGRGWDWSAAAIVGGIFAAAGTGALLLFRWE
jgi:ABC-2 type transport system permease protein